MCVLGGCSAGLEKSVYSVDCSINVNSIPLMLFFRDFYASVDVPCTSSIDC